MLTDITKELASETDPVNQEILMQRHMMIKGVERDISKYLGTVILK
ncbi:hypothetical protein [Pedobacter panaciterrae]